MERHPLPVSFWDGYSQRISGTSDTGQPIEKAGKGRCIHNVRIERLWRSVTYEDIFLQHYANVSELYAGVTRYFHHDNTQRPHPALGYKTPEAIYYPHSQRAKAVIVR